MEPSSNNKSEMDVDSPGVIIIDPTSFSKKKVVHTIIKPPNGKYKSAPLDIDMKSLKLTDSLLPSTTAKPLEERMQKPTKLLFPSLSVEQNRKIQKIRENFRRQNQLQNHLTFPHENFGTTPAIMHLNQKEALQNKPFVTPLVKYIEFINEALFDEEQLPKKTVKPVDDSDDEVLEFEEETLEYVLEIPRTNSVGTQAHIEFITNGVQTEEPAEDRINCGFVNVSKTGEDKYFNLRCFYCDAEFPISFWSEFSDHVIDTHSDLEKVYVENDAKSVSDDQTFNDENNIFNEPIPTDDDEEKETTQKKLYIDLIDKEQLSHPIINEPEVNELLPEDFDDGNDWDSSSDGEPIYMSAENYEVCLEHCYSRSKKKKKMHAKSTTDGQTIDQISFENTSYAIIIDFLDHLKGFPSLWQDRNLNIERYNNDLLDLLAIMTEKWKLNLKKGVLRKNLENIKAWFIGMSEAKEGRSNMEFTKKYIDYYTKCAEYMPCGDTWKPLRVYCDICSRYCFDPIGLQIHKYRKHSIGQLPYSCNKCDKRFDYIHKLRVHLQKHAEKESEAKNGIPSWFESEAICAECDKKFRDPREFHKHLELHTKGNCHFVCDICGYRSRTAGMLNNHKRRHQVRVKEKIHACDECGYRCTTISLLNAHKRRHREPTFQCELCPKRFHFSHHLKKHMTTHIQSYDYVCETCGKLFTRKTYLMDHVKYMHMGYGFCKICNRVYGKQCIYVKHLRTQHRPLIGTIEELTNRYGCNENGKSVFIGPRLKCRKYTSFVDPVTKKRILKCDKCDKCYNQYDSLYAHYKKVHGSTVPGYTRRLTGNQKLFNNRRKRTVKTAKPMLADPNEEAAAAVTSIIEKPDMRPSSPISQNNRISICDERNSTDGKAAIEDDIKEFKNVTPISSFEHIVKEMCTIKGFVPDTANQHEAAQTSNPATAIKMENCLTDFEFLLNNSSPIHFS